MLVLDAEGVIRDATLGNEFSGEPVAEWIGSPWADTVIESDSEVLRRVLTDANHSGVSAFRHLTQRFPSGLELPIEYTAVGLGDHRGLIAVGKNLRAVVELQARLVEAQQAMERDYWKLRDVETRYRLLLNSSNDAVLLLKADLTIAELNPAAAQAVGISVAQSSNTLHELRFPDLLMAQEREFFESLVRRVRERGKAPGIELRLGQEHTPWVARASMVVSAADEIILVQLAPFAAIRPAAEEVDSVRIEDLVEGSPDGFAVIDHKGLILRANRAFLDLVQMGSEATVVGESLGRWLGRPGADLTVLLGNVVRLGSVRLFSTTLRGELGTEIEAEISASGRGGKGAGHVGVFIRDVSRRLATPGGAGALDAALESLSGKIGKTTLRDLVDDTVAIVERRYIDAALGLTGGNRTAAAGLLGLSRQSLYVKLNRYGLDDDAQGAVVGD